MAKTVVAIYDDFQTANDAVRDLVDNGFPRDHISVIANDSQTGGQNLSPNRPTSEGTVADETGAGAGVGAGIGAAIGGIGGLLIGLGALTIPGIGPVIAAGPLAVALSTITGAGVGAVAGGVTGGLLGALIGLGIPEEQAEYYAEGVRRGGVLVTVQADEYNADQITGILNKHNPLDINERVSAWRQQGWKGFNPSEKPFSPEDMARERKQWQIATTGSMIDSTAQTTRVSDATGMDQAAGPDRDLFINHYNTSLARSGYPFDYYLPAYQYGYGLRTDPRYEGLDWPHMVAGIQQDWETRYPDTWDRFEPAIRYGWEGAA